MVKQKLDMKPRISVIIPTKNRCSVLKKVLQALEKQDCSRYSFEVIVIDDLSTDGTPAFLSDFAKRTSLTFSFFPGKGQSAGAARNIGLAKAKGDLVLFLDCDTIPNLDLVRRHLQFQNRLTKTIDCVMGQVCMDPELEIPNQARMWETDLQVPNGNPTEVTWWHFRTANTSMKRAACDLVGGFDIRLEATEDTELAYRLSKRGVRFYYDASIAATHYHPMSLEEYLRKGEMYGRAIALWYYSTPELRRTLAGRYGVYAPESPFDKKVKYFLRGMLVNRATIRLILFLGEAIRTRWFSLSDRLYQCGYRYRTRKAFRETCGKFSFSKGSTKISITPFESATIKH